MSAPLPSSDSLACRIATRTAAVAAVFSLIVATLMVYEYFCRTQKDPSQSRALAALKVASAQQPSNEAIRDEYRKLDQIEREQWFHQKTLALIGAWLLGGGIVVSLAAARWAAVLRRRHPLPLPTDDARDWEASWTPAARLTVSGLFVILAFVAIGLSVPLHTTAATDPAVVPPSDNPPNSSPAAVASSIATPSGGTAAITEEELARAWPCFRGRSGSGISPYANVPDDWNGATGKNILWKSPLPSLPGNSSPIIVAGRIFLTAADDNKRQVLCYDANSGKQLWQQEVPSTPESRKPVKLNDDTGYAACTMVTDGRYVAAIFANCDIAGYDLDGKLAWSQSLGIPENPYGHAASLAIYKNLVIVPIDQANPKAARSKLRALDIATGKTVWEQTRAVPSSWTTPIIMHVANRDLVVTVASPWIVAYNPADGKEVWKVKGSQGDMAPSPVPLGDAVIAAGNDSAPVLAIRVDGSGDVTASHVLWKAEDNTPDICSPLGTEEFVFLLTTEGMVTCYDANKGEKFWEEDLNDFKCKASPAMVGKLLYVFGESGKCWILSPSKTGVKRVRQADLGEGCVTCPAFQDGRMYLRGKKNLYCIGQSK